MLCLIFLSFEKLVLQGVNMFVFKFHHYLIFYHKSPRLTYFRAAEVMSVTLRLSVSMCSFCNERQNPSEPKRITVLTHSPGFFEEVHLKEVNDVSIDSHFFHIFL